MDLNDLKTILQKEGGKIIIVEDGQPVMVVSLYALHGNSSSSAQQPQGKPEQEEPGIPEPEPEEEELTVDDLPL